MLNLSIQIITKIINILLSHHHTNKQKGSDLCDERDDDHVDRSNTPLCELTVQKSTNIFPKAGF